MTNDRTRIHVPLLAICAVVAWASSGCGDDATRPPSETLRVASVTVTPAAASLTAPDADRATERTCARRQRAGDARSGGDLDERATGGRHGRRVGAGGGGRQRDDHDRGDRRRGRGHGDGDGGGGKHGDRAALAALHAATDGPNWADDENWLGDGPLGEWRGVETDAFGRVARLDLGGRRDGETGEWVSHGLRGSIPPELGSLSGLTSLNLRANALAGPIPPELGNLAGLEELWLDGNRLEGPVPPELGSLAHLRELSLSGNTLKGPIPPELGALAGLEGLWLDGNRLEGPIPPELGSLAHLRGLSLSGNALSGPVPSELGGLRRLEFLYLNGNALTGALPRSLVRIGGLVRFRFERNDGLCAPGTAEFMVWLDGIGGAWWRTVLQREGPGGAGRAACDGGRRGLDRLGGLAERRGARRLARGRDRFPGPRRDPRPGQQRTRGTAPGGSGRPGGDDGAARRRQRAVRAAAAHSARSAAGRTGLRRHGVVRPGGRDVPDVAGRHRRAEGHRNRVRARHGPGDPRDAPRRDGRARLDRLEELAHRRAARGVARRRGGRPGQGCRTAALGQRAGGPAAARVRRTGAPGIPAAERQRPHRRDSAGVRRPVGPHVPGARRQHALRSAPARTRRPSGPGGACASRTTTCRARCQPNSAASGVCAGWGSRATPGCRARYPRS